MALTSVQCRPWRLSNNGHQGPAEEGAEICAKRRLELERSTACPHCKRLLRGPTAVAGSCCRGTVGSSFPGLHEFVSSPLPLCRPLGSWPQALSLPCACIGDFDEEIWSERSSCHRPCRSAWRPHQHVQR